MRNALVLNVVSLVTFLAAVFFLVTKGLHLSVEFTGGTLVEVQYAQAPDLQKVRAAVDALGLGESQVQNFGTARDVLVRLPVRGGVKQTEVAGRVFEQLCKAESGAVGTEQFTSPKGEAISRQVCKTASGVAPLNFSRS